MGNRRVWWGTGAFLVGVGAALLTGTGIAAADDGPSGRSHASHSEGSDASQQADKAAAGINTYDSSTKPTGKGDGAVAATLSDTRTTAAPAVQRMMPRTQGAAWLGDAESDAEAPAAIANPARTATRAVKPPTAPTRPAIVMTDQERVEPGSVTEDSTTVKATESGAATLALGDDFVFAQQVRPKEATITATTVPATKATTPPPTDPPSILRTTITTDQETAKPASSTGAISETVAIPGVSAPAAKAPPAPGPVATLVVKLLTALGWTLRPEAVAAFPVLAAWAVPSAIAAGASVSP